VPFRGLIALLAAAPAGMFVCHAFAYRAMRAAGRRPTAHTSAFAAIGAWFVVTLVGAGMMVAGTGASFWSLACGAVYVCATYVALAILYVDAVNIAETSLHMHVLLEVAWSERPSLARLIDRYGAERMIAERLARLGALGQVNELAGRFRVANRSTLRLNRALDAWRTVIGLPTSPEQSSIT
jgi:hypothetical protein